MLFLIASETQPEWIEVPRHQTLESPFMIHVWFNDSHWMASGNGVLLAKEKSRELARQTAIARFADVVGVNPFS